MAWIGPFQLRRLLENSLKPGQPMPPEADGVYVVSLKQWTTQPTANDGILYVGGNTGKSKRFRTRVGDLVADMLGFYGSETGHHSGGQTLCTHCREKGINPLNLWLGWRDRVACRRCAEIELFDALKPIKNKSRPSKCGTCSPMTAGKKD